MPKGSGDFTPAIEAFQRAKIILFKSGDNDPIARRRLYYRLAQLEAEMTYRTFSLHEKGKHMDTAEKYLEEAFNAAEQKSEPCYMHQLELERAFMKGRRVMLGKKRDAAKKELATQAGAAKGGIETAMQKLEVSNSVIFEENQEWRDYWIKHLNDFK